MLRPFGPPGRTQGRQAQHAICPEGLMSRYVLALDQGTSSSRAILFDEEAQPVAVESREFPQIYPQAGWVEHNPEDIWSSQLEAAQAVLHEAGGAAGEGGALGVTTPRGT